ncbi:hydroxymethylbilane synthase [Paracoccaceae bacterium GXU_MW_L88]
MTVFDAPVKIGTRGSPLALAQAYETRGRLMEAHGLPEEAFEVVVIKTSGDRIQDRALREVGGKGLFTKEIEEALLSGGIDIAVHSMKDMPTVLPDGLALTCYLPREDVRDALVSFSVQAIDELAEHAVVGTSSLRRRAQLLHKRPDLEVVEFRGNVQTRMQKLRDGVAEATFLATAGLHRLGMADTVGVPIPVEDMLPAVAQGAIGIEQRETDQRIADILAPINHEPTEIQLRAERAFLAGLDGSCNTPIGGFAELNGGEIWLRGEIIAPDGSAQHAGERRGAEADAAELGADLAAELKKKGGTGFFSLI